MTKDEAIRWINMWRQINLPKGELNFCLRLGCRITSGEKFVNVNSLADRMISQIQTTDYDPIWIVHEYYIWMDSIYSESDFGHEFAGYMSNLALDLLEFLRMPNEKCRERRKRG